MRGENATGGSRPDYALRRRIADDEWEELLAGRKTPDKGRGAPANIIRRPVQLPPMVRIKDAGN